MVYLPRWQIILMAVITFVVLSYLAPNFMSVSTQQWMQTHLPSWLPGRTINLGLDLRGGSHLLLEVDTASAFRDRVDSLLDQVRAELRGSDIKRSALVRQGDAVRLSLMNAESLEAAKEKLSNLDADLALETLENLTLQLRFTEPAIKRFNSSVVEQSIEIIRRRIDETGTREPSIQRQGENRIVVQLPGVDDPTRIKSLLGQTAKLTFRFVDNETPITDNPRASVKPDREILPAAAADEAGRYYVVHRRVMVSGENLVDAQPSFQTGLPVVSFRFDGLGGRRFGDATKENVGRLFAIVLDGKVISAPVIREAILGGSGVISGNFTAESATDLALLLRAGALPAPLQVLEERTVGPGLGADSIKAGVNASWIGFVLLSIFIILVYGLFGIFAVVALVINVALLLGLLSMLGATLTLPGIAGIILTLGTAVDANVLIFERIREEMRLGRSPISAVDAGYNRAMSAILDANVTSLVAALLMFFLGSGPIKGFAATLTIGTATSMFTAIMITRLFVVIWLRRTRPKAIPL